MRIVSLCPSMTHTLHALGLGSKVVGVTKFCINPPAAKTESVVVGGTKDPDVEKIKKLCPDLVFVNKEENRREDWMALAGSGVECFISHPVDVPSTLRMIREMGNLLNCPFAEKLAQAIEATRLSLNRAGKSGSPLSWVYLIWRKPWMTVNKTTYIHGLLAEVAKNNVFANADQAYPAISAKDLREADPDRVFLSSEPFPFKVRHCEELAEATGLPRERFQLVDGERLSWHGAMTQAGLAYVGDLFFNK